MKIKEKYKKRLDLYKQFAIESVYGNRLKCVLTDEHLKSFLDYDANGIGKSGCIFDSCLDNGYLYGQRMVNITVGVWLSILHKRICTPDDLKSELFNDDSIPNWFVEEFFSKHDTVKIYKSGLTEDYLQECIEAVERRLNESN